MGLGEQISDPTLAPAALTTLHASMAGVILLAAFLGGLIRHRLLFGSRAFRVFPITPLEMLGAELVGGVLEVFPLLGAAGLLGLGVGVSAAQPTLAVWMAVVTGIAIAWLLLIQHLVGTLRRAAIKRAWAWVWMTTIPVLLAVAWFGGKAIGNAAVEGVGLGALPGALARRGLMLALEGEWLAALTLEIPLLLMTGALALIVAWAHARELASEPVMRRGRSRPIPALFAGPSAGVAWLFLRQVFATTMGKFIAFVPALSVGALVFAVRILRDTLPEDPALGARFAALLEAVPDLPLLIAALPACVLMNDELWMNQFGWDRRAIRTLLLIPVPMESIVLGKFLGLGLLAVGQMITVAAVVSLVHVPGAVEVVAGVAGAGIALLVTSGVGHVLSGVFPRPMTGDGRGGESTPLGIKFIPFGINIAVISLVGGVAYGLWRQSPLGTFAVLLAIAAVFGLMYTKALPQIARAVLDNRDTLIRELG